VVSVGPFVGFYSPSFRVFQDVSPGRSEVGSRAKLANNEGVTLTQPLDNWLRGLLCKGGSYGKVRLGGFAQAQFEFVFGGGWE
jgi:hypothetical protein